MNALADLSFDAPSHTYRWRGQAVPSVTQLLERAHSFHFLTDEELAAAQDRGTYVHEGIEFDDLGQLDESELAGEYGGYFRAWRSFMADYGANWEGIEERGYSQRFGFAGTLDRRGTLTRLPGRWTIDAKTSEQKYRVWGLQTAAYRQIVAERDPVWLLSRRATVQLRKDGKYRFTEWADPRDWPAFLALLTLTDWSANVH